MDPSQPYQPAGSRTEFFKTALQFDEPAFLRRAKAVETSWASLRRACESKRTALFEVASVRLGLLAAFVDHDWSRLTKVLADVSQTAYLQELFEQWRPALRSQVVATNSESRWIRAVKELNTSLGFFNERWANHLKQLDLSSINEIRDGYNKYYVIEKSCAFDSECIGRTDFEPLPMITCDQLLQLFPPLARIELR